jgi:glutaconate CoA-transferase subunit B
VNRFSVPELMATVLSRRLRDGDVVITGTNAAIPAAAYRMAQAQGRRIVAISGGVGTIDPTAAVIPSSSGDEDLRAGRFRIPLSDVVRAEIRGNIDVIFLGALQVDARGRCNLVAVGDYESPTLRGPGTLGLSLLATVPRAYMYLTRHDPRTFVERVDFVSAEGLREGGRGIQGVVTPLAVLEPDRQGLKLRLASVHPGTTVQEVVRATGFPLDTAEAVETAAPSDSELEALRSVDRTGQLGLVEA